MVEISRIHTTLKISLLLQMKVTKNCFHRMRFLGSNATEMRWRLGSAPDPAGRADSIPLTPSLDFRGQGERRESRGLGRKRIRREKMGDEREGEDREGEGRGCNVTQ